MISIILPIILILSGANAYSHTLSSSPPSINLLEEIDFLGSEVMELSFCEVQLEGDPDAFWNTLPTTDQLSCEDWKVPVLSYVSREIAKVSDYLNYVHSIISINVDFRTAFEKAGEEPVFTPQLLETLTSMAYYNEEKILFGWLYDGAIDIADNSPLAAADIHPLIWQVARCSSKKREELEPAFIGLCQIKDVDDVKDIDSDLSWFLESYGEALATRIPRWQTALPCPEESEKQSHCFPMESRERKKIEKEALGFFQSYVTEFHGGGACLSVLYNQELNQLCEAIKAFGLKSLACEEYAQKSPVLFEAQCNKVPSYHK